MIKNQQFDLNMRLAKRQTPKHHRTWESLIANGSFELAIAAWARTGHVQLL
jgi:hypothetical protein